MSEASYIEKAENIASQTRLSEKEAELYILHVEKDYSIRSAGEYMGISGNNALGKWGDIKDKIIESRKTAELDIP